MDLLKKTLDNINPVDVDAKAKAKERVDFLLKPVGSLGVLEDIAIQLAGITGEMFPEIEKKAIVCCAGDHGICEEGITSAPQPVTALMTNFIPNGVTGVGVLAKQAGADLVVVDVGVNAEIDNEKVINKKIRMGTGNIKKGPAMTKEEAIKSIEVGIEIAEDLINKGYKLLGTGEMGIGNTTPSSAIFSVLGDLEPEEVTGVGANLPEDKVKTKIEVIREAIKVNNPDKNDPIDILSKVGGLEIGAMAGVMLAGAAHRVPVVVDGFISTASAAIATKLNPEVFDYLICSHLSAEKAASSASKMIGFKPYLDMGLRLGEGSGAAIAFNIIEGALMMNKEMATFGDANIGVV